MNSQEIHILVLINAICGGVLAAGGAISAWVVTINNAGVTYWTGVVLGGIGVLQLVSSAVVHYLQTNAAKDAAIAALQSQVAALQAKVAA